ncbi:hypothetical protein LCGC14_1681520 [marine sediment metagenome]|uniref:Transglycosylase SLT domain-containing protein n=1 Tax=marine sediment metagenome TaxID=412755 RepID=A0A0F9HNJ0_9ZZZZ
MNQMNKDGKMESESESESENEIEVSEETLKVPKIKPKKKVGKSTKKSIKVEKSIQFNKFPLQSVFMMLMFIIVVVTVILVFKNVNENLKIEIAKIAEKHTIEIKELESEKQEVIETAFAVKDELLSRHYAQDSKQFEDFMLNGTKIIIVTYELEKPKKVDRLTKDELKNYLTITFEGAKLIGIDPYLILAIDRIESGYNKNAVSYANARGISQFMPGTAKMVANSYTNFVQLQVSNYSWKKLYDPVYIKKLQLRFMKHLLEQFDGRIQWALFAYNYGPDHVARYEWEKGEAVFSELPKEKQKYADDVLMFYNKITTTDQRKKEETN